MIRSLFEELPVGVQHDVQEYVEENSLGETFEKWLKSASRTDVLDAYLTWNGILGYTGTIMNIVDTLSGTTEENVLMSHHNLEDQERIQKRWDFAKNKKPGSTDVLIENYLPEKMDNKVKSVRWTIFDVCPSDGLMSIRNVYERQWYLGETPLFFSEKLPSYINEEDLREGCVVRIDAIYENP